MTEFRIVPCDVCGTEGRIAHFTGWRIRPWGPEETGWEEPCAECEGTGGMLIEVEPIELEDLDTE